MGWDNDQLKEFRNQDWRKELRSELPNKERIAKSRTKMPEYDSKERIKSNVEVNQGFTLEQAIQEATRCLDCVNPTCISGCPVEINIPAFIKNIERKDIAGSFKVLKESNSLPAVCGRVCPQEKQCEASCFYTQKLKQEPVAIGSLERFVADYMRDKVSDKYEKPESVKKKKDKIGVIGSGPAGLSFAGEMALNGYSVTVFEALHEIGGVLKYGIPEFRLPNEIVDFEINGLKELGVEFKTNFIVGKTASIDMLVGEGFKAFFIGSGAGLPRFMNIPGENLNGVMSSNEYLTRINLMKAADDKFDTPIVKGKNVIVVGGGNTAMDSVRTAKRLGAERAIIVYRRSRNEMPARIEEVIHAEEEGIEFMNLTNPIEYFGDENGKVAKVKLQKMELGEPDQSGRRRPVPIEGSEFIVDTDLVVVSVGVSPNPLIPQAVSALEVSSWGTIIVDDEMHTSVKNMFAGGDIVRGGATVILAMGDGKKAARAMQKRLEFTY